MDKKGIRGNKNRQVFQRKGNFRGPGQRDDLCILMFTMMFS